MARSLRSRLVVGTLLWTGGLLVVVHLVVAAAVHHALQGHPIELQPFGRLGVVVTASAAALLLGGGFFQVRRGLDALEGLRARLTDLRAGRAERLHGSFPAEVEPLVDDLNALLGERDEGVRRALARAGDLAHGLKTPLAVLAQQAERAAACGDRATAEVLAQQVERMRRQVEHHLVQARAVGVNAAVRGPASPLLATAEALARTLLRLHASRGVGIELAVAGDELVAVRGEDLEEMLGNLLDNACKWARSRVVVSARRAGETLCVSVEDDGPGLAIELRETVLRRGVRADESAPGSGLGLAIVQELARLYGGEITLGASPAGGLRACLTLPAAR